MYNELQFTGEKMKTQKEYEEREERMYVWWLISLIVVTVITTGFTQFNLENKTDIIETSILNKVCQTMFNGSIYLERETGVSREFICINDKYNLVAP